MASIEDYVDQTMQRHKIYTKKVAKNSLQQPETVVAT